MINSTCFLILDLWNTERWLLSRVLPLRFLLCCYHLPASKKTEVWDCFGHEMLTCGHDMKLQDWGDQTSPSAIADLLRSVVISNQLLLHAASAFLSGPHCPHPGVWTTVFSCLFWAVAFVAYKVWHWVFLESNLEISVTWYCPVDWQPGLGVAALDLLMSETKCVELYRLPARTANGVLNRISSRYSAMMRAGHFSACVWIVS